MQWIRRDDGRWLLPDGSFKYTVFDENLKDTAELGINKTDDGKAIVYIPTHNIHDVYEWYRIYRDSYLYVNDFDKHGHAIHGYFSKERGQSIDGWFPNLVKVKAASSDVMIYFATTSYNRRSPDNITVFTGIEDLIIDGVAVYDEELVLLRHQYYEIVYEYGINTSLSSGYQYYVSLPPDNERYFGTGNACVVKDVDGNYFNSTISTMYTVEISGQPYLVITVADMIVSPVSIADLVNGSWYKNTQENTNGVYQYKDGVLSPIPEMSDKYSVYNQIVYVYQGITNQNKEYYLRRNDIPVNGFDYGKYPIINGSRPLYYSEGDAYLLKCELDYNLDPLHPAHPTTIPPYASDEDVYRLLFLDYTMADKIMTTDVKGIGTYHTVDDAIMPSDIPLGTGYVNGIGGGLSSLQFATIDINSIQNAIYTYVQHKFFDSPVVPSFTFRRKVLTTNTALSVQFTNDSPVNDSITITQNTNTTTISAKYISTLKFISGAFAVSELLDLRFSFYDEYTDTTHVALEDQFVIVSYSTSVSQVVLEIYPKLDDNFLLELATYNSTISPSYNIPVQNILMLDVSTVNVYGQQGTDFTEQKDEHELLLAAINKTFVGRIYDLSFYLDGTTSVLRLNGMRQGHGFKFENYGTKITSGSTIYAIDHTAHLYHRKYLKGYYNIISFLEEYLDCIPNNQIDIAQLSDVECVYNNTLNVSDRFGIEGSNKVPGKGNIILFGHDYKEMILDNIKKDTIITVTPGSTASTRVWVSGVTWSDDEMLGRITTLNDITIPVTGEMVELVIERYIVAIADALKKVMYKDINQRFDSYTDLLYDYPAYKPDTASYAYALLNYGYDTGTNVMNTKILDNITGIVYKEFNEPRISLLKRDKTFLFNNGDRIQVVAASTANVNLSLPITTLDGVTLAPNDLVVIKDQITLEENGVYVFINGSTPLVDYGYMYLTTSWVVGPSGSINKNKVFKAFYQLPLVRSPLTTPVTFVENDFSMKMDNRLTLKPIEIAKLGVDNDTQPWKKINMKYDSIEEQENLVNIEIGINNRHRIRFIDGLTEFNILNDINGQGIYAWILDEDVIVDDAVVGCTQDAGPGTGTLIWYTGTWTEGVWVNGIWIQGTWEAGTWLNGTFNAYPIQDYYYYVTYTETQNQILSSWAQGIWVDGIFNSGIAINITWLDGTFNGGMIMDGTWADGIFNNGVIKHIVWTTGTFNGGDFCTGTWANGTFVQADPTIPARFGIGADGMSANFRDKAIWYTGIFDGGEFWSGLNQSGGSNVSSIEHRGSIWYSGEFKSGDWYGGSFVTGVFKNATWHGGVWFGGYYASITNLTGSNKRLTINPAQYDAVLGLSDDAGYMANTSHKMHTYYQTAFKLLAYPTASNSFTYDAFINEWDKFHTGIYVDKPYVTGSATDTTLDLTVSSVTVVGTSYQTANPATHTVDGRPFVCATFKNATWKNGIWLNGYMESSVWECGAWVNGFLYDVIFGINSF